MIPDAKDMPLRWVRRLSYRAGRLSYRVLSALLVLLVLPELSRGQIAPPTSPSIMEAPIRSLRPASLPVELSRILLTLEPGQGASSATAAIYAGPGTDSLLVLDVSNLDITDVRLPEHEQAAMWQVDQGQLRIQRPDPALEWWRVDIDYDVRGALFRREKAGRTVALWTSSLPGGATWMPLPVDETAVFDVHLSVSAPRGWTVRASGMDPASAMEWDGRAGVQASLGDVHGRALGFLAWADDLGEGPVAMTQWEAMSYIGLDVGRLQEIVGDPEDAPYVLFDPDGETTPAAFAEFGVRATGGLDTRDSWMRRYEQLMRDYQLMVTPTLARLAPTDTWIEAALSAMLAIDQMRSEDGEATAALVLEHLRSRYLSEAGAYVRPLVWDRWEVASDLADQHAEAKGVWVLNMLGERVGAGALTESLRRFIASARQEVVDTETLREHLEVVSREDLRPFFDTWVYAAGHPVLSMDYTYNASSEKTDVTLLQLQDAFLVPEVFNFEIALQYSTLAETNSKSVQVDARTYGVELPTGMKPRFIHPDALASVLLDFGEPLPPSDLVSQLRYSVAPASSIRSLQALSRDRLDPTLLLGLRAVLSEDADPVLLVAAAPALARMAPSTSALNMLISWTTHADVRVRTAATTALGAFEGSDAAYDAALAVANTGGDAFELAAAVESLVGLRPERAWPVLRSALVTSSDGDLVRIRALALIDPETADEDEVARAVLPLLDSDAEVAAAALRCLARIFPEGPRTTRTAEAWIQDASYLKRSAALDVISGRTSDALPRSDLQAALAYEPTVELQRQITRMLARVQEE